MNTTKETKPQMIKSLIADNKLSEAVAQMMGYTEQQGLTSLHNQLVIQSGKLAQNNRERIQGSVDYADLARTRVNICLALLDLVDQLPEHGDKRPAQKLSGLPEWRFKRQVMVLLAVGKIFLFLFIFTVWQSGGLTFDGFLGTMGIVFPVFATYLSTAYQDIIAHRHDHRSSDKLRVNRTVQWSAYVFFAVYYIAIFTVIYLNTIGEIPDPGKTAQEGIPSYKNLFAMLALVESFIGVYIGKLIFSLFKKDN